MPFENFVTLYSSTVYVEQDAGTIFY